ncbi:MAG: short-chain dehydrogenase, partial [Burkholderiales bacterium PBB4]
MNRKDVFDLTDRVIVITGGLGQIGRQFALELIDRGAKVAIFNRSIPDEASLKDHFPVDSGRVAFFKV